ncbi:MAG: hypothetical protein ACRDMV_18000 [Streptosporangiales bacterium]
MDLAASAGLHLDAHQGEVLDGGLGERSDGRWAAPEVAVLEPRQNGKGAILEARALVGLVLFEERLILWSAHKFDTAQEHFLRVRALFDNTDHLRKRVKSVRLTAGEQGIEMLNGCRLRFLARTGGSGRGFSPDLLILDEAYALTDEQVAAVVPAQSARPNVQIWYASSAPLVSSVVLRRLCHRGRAGGEGLAYFEWCAADDAASDDRAAWAEANPALGDRIGEDAIVRELGTMDEGDFRRERLGIWPMDAGSSEVDAERWRLLADPSSAVTDPVAVGVDVRPDRSGAVVAVAGRRGDGLSHVEVVERRKGTHWLVARLVDLVEKWAPCAVVVDPGSAAGGFIPQLEEHGVCVKPDAGQTRLELVTSRQVAQASGAFATAVADETLRHLGQPELHDAVDGAATRRLGDAWTWDRKTSGVDISPLVAATLALHGFAVYGPNADYDVLESIF